jgi:hypothetical protein
MIHSSLSAPISSPRSPSWDDFSSVSISPEERLLALIVFSQTTQANFAETSIQLSYDELDRLRQQAIDALQQALEAKKDSGFWSAISELFGSDIASIAAVVVAAAAVIATGGAATAIVAAVAAAAALAAKHAEDLGIPAELAVAIAVVAAVASLCCGNGAALFKVSDTVRTVACHVRNVAGAVNGAATAIGGVASAVQGKYDSDALHAEADARWANGRSDLENASIEDAIAMLRELLEQRSSMTKDVASMLHRQQQAENTSLLTMAGAA